MELPAGADAKLGEHLAQQLAAGALGERLHPHCAQHLACDAQLVARLGDTAFAAQQACRELLDAIK